MIIAFMMMKMNAKHMIYLHVQILKQKHHVYILDVNGKMNHVKIYYAQIFKIKMNALMLN